MKRIAFAIVVALSAPAFAQDAGIETARPARVSALKVAMSEVAILRYRTALKLTAAQEKYWPAVASALRALAQAYAARPGQPVVAVTAFDDVELSDLLPYPVTVIDHDARELGRVAAKLLLDRLEGAGRELPQRVVEIGTTLVTRG